MKTGNYPTERFSNRVENYVKYRPSYPTEAIDTLILNCRIDKNSLIADIGSGTGIFTALLINAGLRVFAVEPNNEMRLAAEDRFNGNKLFESISGTAENTGLDARSIDLITAAQSFHWFDLDICRQEFRRILKPDGFSALIWNQRKTDSPFQNAYDRLLEKYVPEYGSANHRNIDDTVIRKFFGNDSFKLFIFYNVQRFDFEGLAGRMLSSSYTPTPDNPRYGSLMAGLKALFEMHSQDNHVMFEYETRLFIGKLK